MSFYGPLGAILGLVSGVALWRAMAPVMAAPVFARKNFRGRDLTTSSGLILGPLVLAVAAASSLWFEFETWGGEIEAGLLATTILILPLVLFGLLDDLAGDGTVRGLRGHIGSALKGRLTTGMVKLVGTLLASLWVAALITPGGGDAVELLRVASLLALCANLGNLFDLAPGRAIKVGSALWLPLILLHLDVPEMFGPSLIFGAVLALLPAEMGERSMLGDTGANALGGAVGITLVFAIGPFGQWLALCVSLALTLVSERFSFSKVIRSVPPLQWLDQIGRRPIGDG